MRFTRNHLAPTLSLSLAFGACLPATRAHARRLAAQETPERQLSLVLSPEAAGGIEAYERGDFAAAVKFLKKATGKRKDDANSWHFLGAAYRQQGKEKEARKAFEQAIHFRMLRILPEVMIGRKKKYDDLTPEERVALRRQYAAGYKATLASVESYLQLNPKEADFWRAQAESLRFYAEESAKPEAEKTVFYSSDEGVAKAVISYKPEPLYTNEARNKGTTGVTIFRAVLDADGTVKHILALKTLPDGLTENSFAVMRQIRFTPATKDGRPVSQYVAIEYNFNIY